MVFVSETFIISEKSYVVTNEVDAAKLQALINLTRVIEKLTVGR